MSSMTEELQLSGPDTSLSIGRFLCEVSKLSLELLLQDTRSGLHSLPSEKNKALRLLF